MVRVAVTYGTDADRDIAAFVRNEINRLGENVDAQLVKGRVPFEEWQGVVVIGGQNANPNYAWLSENGVLASVDDPSDEYRGAATLGSPYNTAYGYAAGYTATDTQRLARDWTVHNIEKFLEALQRVSGEETGDLDLTTTQLEEGDLFEDMNEDVLQTQQTVNDTVENTTEAITETTEFLSGVSRNAVLAAALVLVIAIIVAVSS